MSDPLPLVRSSRGRLVAQCGGPLGLLLAAVAGVTTGISQSAELRVRPIGRGVRWERLIGTRGRVTSVFAEGPFIVELAGPLRLRFTMDQRSTGCVRLELSNPIRHLMCIEITLMRTGQRLHTDVCIAVRGGRLGWLRYRAEMLDSSGGPNQKMAVRAA